MDMFESFLTQSSGPQVAPETLEMLGRQASQLFQQQGIPLNDAIAQVVANHPDLGNEHLKRIVEFANTVTFQEMFQNSQDKNVHFDVADPGVVLRDLKDGGSPGHDGKPLSQGNDYMNSPKTQEAGFPEVEQLFSQQFTSGSNGGTVDMPKVASELNVDHNSHANPIEDVYDTHVRLQATREKLAASYETMDLVRKDTIDDFYHELKQQVLDDEGAGLGGVVAVLEKVANADFVNTVFAPLVQRLTEEGVSPDHLQTSLEKRAGKVANLEHPLVIMANSISELGTEMAVTSQAIDDMDSMLSDTMDVIKEAGALTSGVKKALSHKGKVPAGVRQRFPRK